MIKPKLFSHVELNNPQQGYEEQVEGHKETEGAAHVRNGLALCKRYIQVRGREGQRGGVGSVQGGDGREAAPVFPTAVYTRHS